MKKGSKGSSVGLICAALLLAFAAPACGGSEKDAKQAAPPERVEGINETIDLFKKKHASLEKLFVATFIIPKKGLMASAAVGGQHLDFAAAK